MSFHDPVLLRESVEFLKINPDGMYLDCTAGFGGHSSEILKHLSGKGQLIMIDRDIEAVEYLRQHFEEEKVEIMHMNYAEIGSNRLFDGILVDLGISSYHVDQPNRGFSYRFNAPLDMRMDNSSGNPLSMMLQHMSTEEISTVLSDFGEENRADQIAASIRHFVSKGKMNTTYDLKDAVIDGCRGRGVKYSLRRVFQALRIMVNSELQSLNELLIKIPSLLNSEGRFVIISYHSLEDRMIKYFLKSNEYLRIINKHVIKPHYTEIKHNKRARSAKMRCAQRI